MTIIIFSIIVFIILCADSFPKDDLMMPSIGFGTAGMLGNTEASVCNALNADFRLIDTAQAPEWYSESELGFALEHCWNLFDNDMKKKLMIVTKIHPRSYEYYNMIRSLEYSKREKELKAKNKAQAKSEETNEGEEEGEGASGGDSADEGEFETQESYIPEAGDVTDDGTESHSITSENDNDSNDEEEADCK